VNFYPLPTATAATALALFTPANVKSAELCGEPISDFPALIASLSAPRPDRIQESDKYIAVKGRSGLITWTVTKPGNPAHPAVVCRQATKRDGAWYVTSESSCAGPKDACNAMMAEFNALDETMRKSIESSRKK
jgi:hypothetical protein